MPARLCQADSLENGCVGKKIKMRHIWRTLQVLCEDSDNLEMHLIQNLVKIAFIPKCTETAQSPTGFPSSSKPKNLAILKLDTISGS